MFSTIALFSLGLILGSFVNALVWRTHKKKDMLKGRSQCVHCAHQLTAADLVPLLSWLVLRGRCRYCQKPISRQYPPVELSMAAVFTLSYIFWPADLVGGQWVLFSSWLAVSVGLLALAVYDLRYMLLPSKILYPAAATAAIGRLVYILGFEPDKLEAAAAWGLSLAIASGLFWLIYIMSGGKAIGFGDVRLGLISGTVLADPLLALLMIFGASVLGTLFVLPGLASRRRSMISKVPYGPFLIVSTFIVLLFGERLSDWYQNLL